jgi:outer membrane protein assembly factor BamD
MHRFGSIIGSLLIGLIFIFLFNGCAHKQQSLNELDHEALLARGLERLEEGNHNSAVRAFQAIKDRYPYTKSAITAELKMAESYYTRKQFDSAMDVYRDFERLHPKDKKLPYVIYRQGMCQFEQIESIDRDQTFTHKAKEEFERLIRRFPDSEYVEKARARIRSCLIYLAEYELYVGDYYYKMGKYGSALNRYKYIIENYPDLGQYHQALESISMCKTKLAEKED